MNLNFKAKYTELKPIIKKAIELAEANAEYEGKEGSIFIVGGNSSKEASMYDLESETSKNLDNFFEELNDNQIMLIQVLMYIGRDEEKDIEPTTFDSFINNYLGEMGFKYDCKINNRSPEISQMTGKIPLGQYLRDGLRKINI